MDIRVGTPADAEAVRELELAAGAPFRDLGMDEIADDEPPATPFWREHAAAGRLWVGTGEGGAVVAFVLLEPVDGCLHVEQVSVRPDHARQGLGARLIEHAADLARREGVPALTLMTFTDVPWNAPYYRRLGFRTVPADALTPGLAQLRAREISLGLHRWPREAMRRPVR